MKRIMSTQAGVFFAFCSSPVTIDKRAAWGNTADNLQEAPDGAFIKMNEKDGTLSVSHLVQPNEDKSAPVGWIPGSGPNRFDKEPIWINEKIIDPGVTTTVNGLDGPMEYTFDEPSIICYNGDENGPDLKDGWVQTLTNLKKNYVY